MLQNTMLTRFLRLGSLFLLFLFIACNTERIDYIIWADWIYINKTEHIIEVKDADYNSFKLSPDSSFIYKLEMSGTKQVKPEDYGTPYGFRGVTIVIEGKEYVMYKGGIVDNSNYEAEKIERNYYRFTYVFNEDTIPKDSE